ncbi:hypothetical protein GWI33_000290 [Rhynchophorus ferrugineus]|uniref:Uncharacterized protein n=1 Tax=Rhynchophorus ferrugineus TaxID=354439 RepID=A0A834IP15_RHYFE|nr:hypothetical protein GWI33_000290 [Rhynchophorus ferrugineus]
MKGMAQLSIILALCFGLAASEAGNKDDQTKPLLNSGNAINPATKPEHFNYQQFAQFGARYQSPQQYQQPKASQFLQQALPYPQTFEGIRKPALLQQHHPVAMVIIAQPAYIPAHLLQQSNLAQQLLGLFHGSNPARYQIFQGNLQQGIPTIVTPLPTPQAPQYPQYQQPQDLQFHPSAPVSHSSPIHPLPTQVSPPASNALPVPQALSSLPHEALPTPEALISHQPPLSNHLSQQPDFEGRSLRYQPQQNNVQYQHHIPANHKPEYQKPLELNEISQLAQQAAQQYLKSGGTGTAPAIITGLENFAPEQQAKIKAQLATYFGAPLQPINVPNGQNNGAVENKYHQEPKKRNSDKFVRSVEVKNGEITQSRHYNDKKK